MYTPVVSVCFFSKLDQPDGVDLANLSEEDVCVKVCITLEINISGES